MTVTSLSMPKDTRCKMSPSCINFGFHFERVRKHKSCAREITSLTLQSFSRWDKVEKLAMACIWRFTLSLLPTPSWHWLSFVLWFHASFTNLFVFAERVCDDLRYLVNVTRFSSTVSMSTLQCLQRIIRIILMEHDEILEWNYIARGFAFRDMWYRTHAVIECVHRNEVTGTQFSNSHICKGVFFCFIPFIS